MGYFTPKRVNRPAMSAPEELALDLIVGVVRAELSRLRCSTSFARKSPDFMTCLRDGLDEAVIQYAAESTSPRGERFRTHHVARCLGCTVRTARAYLNRYADRDWAKGRMPRLNPAEEQSNG